MASSKETYCLCGQPYNIGQFMIECDCCREWFHGSCVDVKIYQSDDIDKYHCPKCSQTYGPSVLKIPTNNHRADRYEVGAEAKASQVGTPAWVRALAARPPRPSSASLQRMRPQQFTEEFVKDNGFTRPVLFTTTDGLDMRTPNPATFTARSVLRFCGAQLEVEVIDVRKQATLRMPLADFVEYLEAAPAQRQDRALNVLSLEFSDTNMSPLVEPPLVARRLDWAEVVWPAAEERPPRPAVQKYCLMSAAGSFTDFHVDFGGTTVWYHVMHGRKVFYLIPPTATNLALYQQWSASTHHDEKFFGDMVEWYGTAELAAGQTLFIPTGWIHAVLTPTDSLVFGGNLLHSYAIETQLQIYEIERRVETPLAFRYPLFEAMHWYAGAYLLTVLRRHNEESQDADFTLSESFAQSGPVQIPPLLLRGIKILANALKEWHALKSSDTAKRDNVPKCVNSGQLVRELGKELRALEKKAAALALKDIKPKHPSPKKATQKQQQSKKSLKLTLPKPIMHMTPNGEFQEDKVYADRLFIDNKEVVYPDHRYNNPQVVNGLPEAKYVVDKEPVLPDKFAYQSYEEMQNYRDNGYVERQDKKGNVLRIKLNQPALEPPPAPPPYPLEASILKSHLVRGSVPKHHQWTISKKDIGDYQEQVLFTNENVPATNSVRVDPHEISYGPGMYSAEDIQPQYQFEPKGAFPQPAYYPQPPDYAPDYAYDPATEHQHHAAQPQPSEYPPAGAGAAYPQSHAQPQPPCYDAALHQHHQHPQYAPTEYVIEEQEQEQKPVAPPPPAPPAPPVRRSERPVRRRVSSSFDYEDGELFIDDAPAPRRRRHAPQHQHQTHAGVGAGGRTKAHYKHAAPSVSFSGVSAPAAVGAPANGIESLIQASVLAEGEPPPTDTEDAAVAGMLSIGGRLFPPALAQAPPGKRARPKPPPPALHADQSDDEDVIKEVHRDEEYVYPSLEMSSDEEEEWSGSGAGARRRGGRARTDSRNRDKDESWSPRARLGRLVPRLRGPARAGTRRECVRAALHAAASASASAARPAPPAAPAPAPQGPARAHQPLQPPQPQNAKRAVLATKSRRPPPPPPPPVKQNMRLKKGMKTAKQRLGKILKIHKMIY